MLTTRLRASLLPFFTLFLLPTSTFVAQGLYTEHCESIVHASLATDVFTSSGIYINNGYYTGGSDLLNWGVDFKYSSTFNFYSRSIHQTQDPDVLQVEGSLRLTPRRDDWYNRNYSRVHPRARLLLVGYWSQSNGRLCMVGRGQFRGLGQGRGSNREFSAVVKLNLSATSNISTSLVTGVVESFDYNDDGGKHFEPISLLGYNYMSNYTSTMIDKVNESCSKLKVEEESKKFEHTLTCFDMEYLNSYYYVFKHGNTLLSLGFVAEFMSLSMIRCSQDRNLSLLITFTNSSSGEYENPMVPETSLVAEGFWDPQNSRLCLLACRILLKMLTIDASVGDCDIRLSLWFPASLSLKKRSSVVGRLWRDKKGNDSTGSNGMVSFQSQSQGNSQGSWIVQNQSQGNSQGPWIPRLKYKYTHLDAAKTSCNSSKAGKSDARYPDPRITNDMQFGMHLNAKGRRYWGYASLVSLNDDYYGSDSINMIATAESPLPAAASTFVETNIGVWNISYKITYTLSNNNSSNFIYDVNLETELSAEGIYNSETGKLCMIGCRSSSSLFAKKQRKEVDSDDMDCGILVDIQLSPLNSEFRGHLSGSIISKRGKKDPLYFDSLEISSFGMYTVQATESIKRMDVEIIMLLLSLTFSCVCVGMQLFHVKKHPDVLPSISIMMLVILTLGHMIPLLLNFEAFFMKNRNNNNILLSTGGWLEAKEVLVRVITMVAFLFQFRLLRASWSSRLTQEDKKGLWVAEKETMIFCLPLYLAGGLITWFVRSRSNASQSQWEDLILEQHSLWKGLMNYAGLILDGFLLPQIILNMFWESKDTVLNPFFYAGTTLIRTLPHLYDVYRARNYVNFASSHIYAGPEGDFYSLAWDIIIPCGGLLFAVIIFLQQRFGGGCIIPTRFRKVARYEAVPAMSLSIF